MPGWVILPGVGDHGNKVRELDIRVTHRYGVMYGVSCVNIWLDQSEFNRYRLDIAHQLCPNQSDTGRLCVW